MASLGTRKFFIPFSDGSTNPTDLQVLKNQGYFSIILHSVFYHSKGNFWQKIFGGSDEVSLISSLNYTDGAKPIEAITIQDKRKVKSNRDHFLGLSRVVAEKVPATGDSLELKVSFLNEKKDNFGNALELMNSSEFQNALTMAPVDVGQVLSVTNVVKKIITGIEDKSTLEATYAGIIGNDQVLNPLEKEMLLSGFLIMISNKDDQDSFLDNADPKKLKISGDGLLYNNKPIEHTYVIYSINFTPLKGANQHAVWFAKYQEALNKLDDLILATTAEEKKNVLEAGQKIWLEGNALLFADPTYINMEKESLKRYYLLKLQKRYNELTSESSAAVVASFMAAENSAIGKMSTQKAKKKDLVKEIESEVFDYMSKLGELNLVIPS